MDLFLPSLAVMLKTLFTYKTTTNTAVIKFQVSLVQFKIVIEQTKKFVKVCNVYVCLCVVTVDQHPDPDWNDFHRSLNKVKQSSITHNTAPSSLMQPLKLIDYLQ